jgi:hypothetical protein
MRNDITELTVSTRFEPCHSFEREHLGSPVCGGCGWLDAEHAGGAVVLLAS